MEKIKETVSFLKAKGIESPQIGIVLGTGLGKLVDEIDIEIVIDYSDIPNFPVSTVEFHTGKLIYGNLRGKKVLVKQGRFHYYEGYTLQEVTFSIRVMKLLGIEYLLSSNACGALNLDFKKGSLMLIDDHINLLPGSPLIGKNIEELGPRFVDMSEPYSKVLNDKIIAIAQHKNIELNKGVYVVVEGPNLETRAEYRYLRGIGADVVGMSTVPEVIVANHMNLPCAAISVITDVGDPDNLEPINVQDILDTANVAEPKLIQIYSNLVAEL